MKLYTTTLAPNPRRVRIFMEEKGIEMPVQEISIMEGEHKQEEYKKISPSSKVPALELDDGTVITESMAICRYLELLHPEPALFGSSKVEQAKIEMESRRIELELMLPIASAFRHTHPAAAALENPQIEEYGIAQRENAINRLNLLDEELGEQKFIAGDDYSVADITALCAIDFGGLAQIEVPSSLVNLSRWLENMRSRPSSAQQ
jgi:glutathione S-transferase|tara:strand:+ start:474 stop:1088 length:615 start_codon:yes stop_codon:yes gene_type:complete